MSFVEKYRDDQYVVREFDLEDGEHWDFGTSVVGPVVVQIDNNRSFFVPPFAEFYPHELGETMTIMWFVDINYHRLGIEGNVQNAFCGTTVFTPPDDSIKPYKPIKPIKKKCCAGGEYILAYKYNKKVVFLPADHDDPDSNFSYKYCPFCAKKLEVE